MKEGLVATTWELSQPQGPSQMVVAGANASRKIELDWKIGRIAPKFLPWYVLN